MPDKRGNRGVRPGNTVSGARRGNPETRAALMDATLRVLDCKSILEATVDDFVSEAGVAKGTFYIYFSDKYAVLAALARRVNGELFSQSHVQLDRNAPVFSRIRVSLRRVIQSWEEHGGFFRSLTQVSLSQPEFLALNQELRQPFIKQIRGDLQSSIERGHAKQIDTAVAAKALAAMMDWFCLLWFGQGEPPYDGAEHDIDHVTDQLALLWYRAVYASDPPGWSDAVEESPLVTAIAELATAPASPSDA